MSDFGEYVADLKELQAQERRDRTTRRLPELQALGAQSFNDGAHWKLRHLSFWPSSGKWHNEKTNKRGRLPEDQPLAKLVKEQLPDEQIQIRETRRPGSDPGATQAEPDVSGLDHAADDVSPLHEGRDMRGVRETDQADMDHDDGVSGSADGHAGADVLGPDPSTVDAGVRGSSAGTVARQVEDGRRRNQRSDSGYEWVERQSEPKAKGQKPKIYWALMRDGIVEDYLRFDGIQWQNFHRRSYGPDLDAAQQKLMEEWNARQQARAAKHPARW